MSDINIGIIGVGRQGSSYVKLFENNMINNATLVAICDIDVNQLNKMCNLGKSNFRCYQNYQEMLNEEDLDGVIVVTPHYSHPEICAEVLKKNLFVLSDKPMGVRMSDIINAFSGVNIEKLQMMFNQRMVPDYKYINELIKNKTLGEIKNFIWEITDWYRPQAYFDLPGWHSTWKGEGGGLMINQCVHNIDLINWFFGLPEKISAKLDFGRYHKTNVDDSAIIILEYAGFTGILVSSTGELPGTNRLEVSLDGGKIVREVNGKIKIFKNSVFESEHSKNCKMNEKNGKFSRPACDVTEEDFKVIGHGHKETIQNFVEYILGKSKPMTNFFDGEKCSEVINAIYLSQWKNEPVKLPFNADEYDEYLNQFIESEV